MRESLFAEYIKDHFTLWVEKAYGEIWANPGRYLFKELFVEKYENGWGLNFQELKNKGWIFCSDRVGQGLPLKERHALGPSEGKIPKIEIRRVLNGPELKEFTQMKSLGLREAVAEKLFCQVKECMEGLYDQMEYMALGALCGGMFEIKDQNNPECRHRIVSDILEENRFQAGRCWADAASDPLSDIERVLESALKKGHLIRKILMPFSLFNRLRESKQVRGRYGGHGQVGPALRELNEYLSQDYGNQISIRISSSAVQLERESRKISLNPWQENKIVFLSSEAAGDLLYTTLASEGFDRAGIASEKLGSYISIYKFSTIDPFSEWTMARARVLPVLKNPEGIYHLSI